MTAESVEDKIREGIKTQVNKAVVRRNPMSKKPVKFKEIGYFGRSRITTKGTKGYLQYFPDIYPGQGVVTGEGSVGYFAAPSAAINIRAYLPHTKLILLLRDPVARSFSRVHHMAQLQFSRPSMLSTKGLSGNTIMSWWENGTTVEEVLDTVTVAVFEIMVHATLPGLKDCVTRARDDGWAYPQFRECWLKNSKNSASSTLASLQNSMKSDGRAGNDAWDMGNTPLTLENVQKAIQTTTFPSSILSIVRSAFTVKTLAHSLYLPQISHWLRAIPAHQICVLKSESFYKNTSTTMEKVASFIGLDTLHSSPDQPTIPTSGNQTTSSPSSFDWASIVEGVRYNVLRDDKGVITLVKETTKPSSPASAKPSSSSASAKPSKTSYKAGAPPNIRDLLERELFFPSLAKEYGTGIGADGKSLWDRAFEAFPVNTCGSSPPSP